MIDRETRAREVMQEINSRIRPERAIDRSISIEKERYGRLRPSRFELNHDQRKLYQDLAQFRVMKPRDIIEYRYGGNDDRYHRDLTPMREFGLLDIHKMKLIHRADTGYQFKDADHDAGVYGLYERTKREIESAHCSVASVRTEADLKREFMKRVGCNENRKSHAIRSRVAKSMGLPFVDGSVMFPDCRLEVDMPDGRQWKHETVDLEYTTGSGSYRGDAIASKQSAGFQISGPNSGLGGTPFGIRQDFGR